MICVAIATLGRPELVQRSVGSILDGTKLPAEIIVVDGGPGEESREVLEAFESDVIRYERCLPGSAAASRNRALEQARSEYVAFVDDDCVMPAEWLESVERQLELHGRPDALYGEVRVPEPERGRKGVAVSSFTVPLAREWRYPVEPQKLGYSGHMIVRRASFELLGGFDERLGPGTTLFGAEDMDYGYRLLKARQRVVTTPAIWVVHEQWRRPDELPRHLCRYNLGYAAFCAKHLRAGDRYPWRLFAIQVGGDLKMLASAARRRSWLRVRVAAWRTIGTWTGLVRGWRAFGPQH